MGRKIICAIENIIPSIEKRAFAIYPCGDIGEFTRSYLQETYHLSASFLIDNYKALHNEEYITTSALKEMDCNKFVFLIASNSGTVYKEIRTEIRKYVPNRNIIDMFPKVPKQDNNVIDRIIRKKLLYPHGKVSFLHSIKNTSHTRILDVGCGNRSPQHVKAVLNKVYYVGIDVGDYNQSEDSKRFADEYHIVKSEEFAEKIEIYRNSFDAVISSHNIEHCDEPERVLKAMIDAMKVGGRLYMAFPSEESVGFPRGRKGCLNFYDDSTHQLVPDWNKINAVLAAQGMKIIYKVKNNRPYIMRRIGVINEEKSRELATTLAGTWEYYGFESIIWAKKMASR